MATAAANIVIVATAVAVAMLFLLNDIVVSFTTATAAVDVVVAIIKTDWSCVLGITRQGSAILQVLNFHIKRSVCLPLTLSHTHQAYRC